MNPDPSDYEGPDSAMARAIADEDARINARMPRDDSNEPEA